MGLFDYLNAPATGGIFGAMNGAYQAPSRSSIIAAGMQDLAANMRGQTGTALAEVRKQDYLERRNYAERERRKRKREKEDQQRQAQAQLALQHPEYADWIEAGYADEVFATLNRSSTPTSLMKNLEAMGLQPGTPEYQAAVNQQLNKSSGGNTTVNVGGQVDLTWKKEQAKQLVKTMDTFNKRSEDSGTRLDFLNRLSTLTESLKDTPHGEGVLKIQELFKSYGVPVDAFGNLDDMQEFSHISNRMVAEELRQNVGPQTDSDRTFTQSYLPNLQQTYQGKKAGIDYLKSRNRLDRFFGQRAREQSLNEDFTTAQQGIAVTRGMRESAPAVAEVTTSSGKKGWMTLEKWVALKKERGVSEKQAILDWIEYAGGQ